MSGRWAESVDFAAALLFQLLNRGSQRCSLI